MPLNEKGKKIMKSMRKQYGKNEEKQFFMLQKQRHDKRRREEK